MSDNHSKPKQTEMSITHKSATLVVTDWDMDNEIKIEVYNHEAEEIWLTPKEVNKLLRYITKKLEEIGCLDKD